MIQQKLCGCCKKILPVSEFQKDKRSKDGFQFYCKECRKKYNQWDKLKDNINYREKNIKRCKAFDDKIKFDVFKHYSNGELKCACCGNTDYRVLNIDHISGGGIKQRRAQRLNGGAIFFRWLIKNNFPDGFRVLCRNCNWIEHLKNQKLNKQD